MFATIGAFPQGNSANPASALIQNNQWLFGGQLGLDWGFDDQDAFRSAVAYYDYENISASPSQSADFTCNNSTAGNILSAPSWMPFGNTVAPICRANATDSLARFYGLASEFKIFNATFSYDLAKFAPHHVIFSGDFAKNIGFDANSTSQLAQTNIQDQTNAWQVRVDFGWPKVDHSGQWNVFTAYKHVDRDAVLASYADSDFHLGGTNAKGWVFGGNYGLMKNVWATGRWLSTDVVSGPRYSNDILQLDLNTRF